METEWFQLFINETVLRRGSKILRGRHVGFRSLGGPSGCLQIRRVGGCGQHSCAGGWLMAYSADDPNGWVATCWPASRPARQVSSRSAASSSFTWDQTAVRLSGRGRLPPGPSWGVPVQPRRRRTGRTRRRSAPTCVRPGRTTSGPPVLRQFLEGDLRNLHLGHHATLRHLVAVGELGRKLLPSRTGRQRAKSGVPDRLH